MRAIRGRHYIPAQLLAADTLILDGWSANRKLSESPTGRQSSQLLKHRLSNNVGGVKHFSSVGIPALRRVRHFALVENVPIQPKPARNQYSGQELSPTHASLRSQPRS